jgi:hypothetical protein
MCVVHVKVKVKQCVLCKGQSQALKCWLCTNKAEDQPGCQWDSLNTHEARLQSRMPRRSDRCNACVVSQSVT